MEIPSPAQDVVAEYQRRIEDALPGFVDSLHLTGSIAMCAYRHGRSDIDFVTVTKAALNGFDTTSLANIHAAMPEIPMLDGLYVTAAQLCDNGIGHFIRATDGEVHTVHDRLPVMTRYELHHHAVTLKGRTPQAHGLCVDSNDVNEWLRDNLNGYWTDYAEHLRGAVHGRALEDPVNPEAVTWAATGPQRLHYTLTTGSVISKQEALDYAKQQFPCTDTDLLDRSLGWRDAGTGSFTVSDAYKAADHIDSVVEASVSLVTCDDAEA